MKKTIRILTVIALSLSGLFAQEPDPTPTPAPAIPVTLVQANAPDPDKVLSFPPLPRPIVELLRTMLLTAEAAPGVPLLGFDETASGLEQNQITRLLLFLNDQGTYTLSIAVKPQPDPTPEPEPTPEPTPEP